MNREKQYEDSAKTCVVACMGAFLLLLVLLLCSCGSTKYVPVETVKTEIKYKDRLQRDSIHVHDSIYVRANGDTIFVDRWHTEYKDRLLRDTVYIHQTDSVQVPYPVEKKLSRWQSIKLEFGEWAIGAIVVLCFFVIWLIKSRKK